ncbi:MAG: PD40 domain-containing protein [Bacteroidetes bacterium]|nr:PD40 domain-containing protein [Bacteroidota bacterium]
MIRILSLVTPFFLLTLFGFNNNNFSNSSNYKAGQLSLRASNDLDTDTLKFPDEKHLKNVRQLTFGGENAEAYFSFDDDMLVFQRTNQKEGVHCDQIYYSDLKNFKRKLVSTGTGRTTCPYFLPGNRQIIFASTHLSSEACPEVPDRKKIGKYVWPIYDSFEMFISDLDGNIIKQLTDNKVYDAEATISPIGDKIVFTSMRSGDLELYTMNIDGSEIKQITSQLGYDGGAFFSADGSRLVFRSSRPKTAEEVKEYKDLLMQGLVAPTDMEIYTCNADGSDLKQITQLGKANWAPYFHPSGKKIIFSSNHENPRGFPFNLYLINIDGSGLEKVTNDDSFDAFPMFSFDGKSILFSSNRNNGGGRDTNVFIAEWID